ncbi:hypothetical protein AJ80_09054 [Polytolypa hystricis UAMH7299]|uniref:Uncharacterized protein n=1 Tax=Polytolypa hystricis (strain UAMH7299) TaxID=1447883 RepID=A0A2B7WX49_POLH7|nr:hypothetical protein AJ80_09054 [Polytolypa hystricis UAMH7299]
MLLTHPPTNSTRLRLLTRQKLHIAHTKDAIHHLKTDIQTHSVHPRKSCETSHSTLPTSQTTPLTPIPPTATDNITTTYSTVRHEGTNNLTTRLRYLQALSLDLAFAEVAVENTYTNTVCSQQQQQQQTTHSTNNDHSSRGGGGYAAIETARASIVTLILIPSCPSAQGVKCSIRAIEDCVKYTTLVPEPLRIPTSYTRDE